MTSGCFWLQQSLLLSSRSDNQPIQLINGYIAHRKYVKQWREHLWMAIWVWGYSFINYWVKAQGQFLQCDMICFIILHNVTALIWTIVNMHSFCVELTNYAEQTTKHQMSAATLLFSTQFENRWIFFLFSWMQPLLDGVKILRLFAVIIYSFKVIIRPHQRNVRSSAPLLPSHQWVIITILLLLSSSLTGWPALKYILNRLQACTKWPIGSLLSVIEWRNSQQGGQWHLQTQSCLSSQTSCCIYEGNLLLFLHYNLPFVQFLTSCTKKIIITVSSAHVLHWRPRAWRCSFKIHL